MRQKLPENFQLYSCYVFLTFFHFDILDILDILEILDILNILKILNSLEFFYPQIPNSLSPIMPISQNPQITKSPNP